MAILEWHETLIEGQKKGEIQREGAIDTEEFDLEGASSSYFLAKKLLALRTISSSYGTSHVRVIPYSRLFWGRKSSDAFLTNIA